MFEKRKTTWISIGMIYACSVIGVGFASGNEIMHFFTSYGMSGFYGILTASAIFSFMGFIIVRICFQTSSYQLSDCYKAVGGPFFASIAGLIGTVFSFCLFVLMLSAWTKILDDILFIPVYARYIIYVVLFVLYGVLDIQNKPLAGWMRLIILSGTGTVLFTIVAGRLIHVFSAYLVTGYQSWFLSAVLYVGYNSFVSADMLCKACKTAMSEKSAVAGGIVGGAILFILSFVFNLIFTLWYRGNHSFPMLDMAGKELYPIKIFFMCVLMLCILYSGFNSGMIVIERIAKKIHMRPVTGAVLLSLLSIVALPVGFDTLIYGVYPIFGFLGSLIVICFVVFYTVKKTVKYRESKEDQ